MSRTMPASVVPIVHRLQFLETLVGKWVLVKMQYGFRVKGKLLEFDSEANIQLKNVEVYDEDSMLDRTYHKTIHGSNIKDVQELDEEESQRFDSYWQSRGNYAELLLQG
ncbi:hypothetical protein TNCT_431061 [Trichonephila clavata]|uniref:Sm domain-containing protein n=1 Tax=Trichonephila clavata TaxID=2740835 RepID=A0A8X6HS75_TRICU|nr:hypothetical protein TNCT_431061 [Trichonephila clavata]